MFRIILWMVACYILKFSSWICLFEFWLLTIFSKTPAWGLLWSPLLSFSPLEDIWPIFTILLTSLFSRLSNLLLTLFCSPNCCLSDQGVSKSFDKLKGPLPLDVASVPSESPFSKPCAILWLPFVCDTDFFWLLKSLNCCLAFTLFYLWMEKVVFFLAEFTIIS